MNLQIIAKLVKQNSWLINHLPPKLAIRLYSAGRIRFMQEYYQQKTLHKFIPDKKWQRTLWGLTFQAPIMNSAGMFKNGEGYDIVAASGAGGYVGGTSTYNPRVGNIKSGIKLPFCTLAKSNTTLNYLGLPNLGDEILAHKVYTANKSATCPIGWSVMASPDYADALQQLEYLVKGLWLYHDNLQIDYLEINQGCPNVGEISHDLNMKLSYIAKNFLNKRKRHLPVIINLSNSLDVRLIPEILNLLFKYKFDGVVLGNTATNYKAISTHIKDAAEQKLFEYFSQTFGGGVGGQYLKSISLDLCKAAVAYRNTIKPNYEFHVLRTGGVDSIEDIHAGEDVGVSMHRWYSGYFTNYIKYGDLVYKNLLT